jgi:regulatory protein NPR1
MNRLEEQPLKSLSQDFLSLLLNGQSFSDVSFAVEGRHVYAHKCVLAARSPFFRMIFCGDAHMLDGAPAVVGSTTQQQQPQPTRAAAAATATVAPQVIPVGIVGHDVFMLLLQFLYTGNLCFSPQNLSNACKEKSCWHTHCSLAVEFALETLNAAHFFGVDQLSTLTQVILLFLSLLLLLLIAFDMLQTSVLQHLLCLLLELDILQTSVNISSVFC